MTQVTFDLRETSAAGATPVGAIQYAPYRRHIDGTTVVLPVAAATMLVNGQVTIELEPTDATWCWQIDERVTGGIYRYVAVPDSPTPVAYTALVDVDPATLASVTTPATSALTDAVTQAQASATAAAASAATAATTPFDASLLTTGTVDDARLPATAQAATLASRRADVDRLSKLAEAEQASASGGARVTWEDVAQVTEPFTSMAAWSATALTPSAGSVPGTTGSPNNANRAISLGLSEEFRARTAITMVTGGSTGSYTLIGINANVAGATVTTTQAVAIGFRTDGRVFGYQGTSVGTGGPGGAYGITASPIAAGVYYVTVVVDALNVSLGLTSADGSVIYSATFARSAIGYGTAQAGQINNLWITNGDARGASGNLIGPINWRRGITTINPRGTVEGVAPDVVRTMDSQGQTIRVLLPATYDPRRPSPVVIVCHGNTGTVDQLSTLAGGVTLQQRLLAAGFIVAAHQQHDNNWGAPAAQTDLVYLRSWLSHRLNIGPVCLMGVSMGALSALGTILKARMPVAGAVIVDGVINLANQWATGTDGTVTDQSRIITAWGLAPDGSDYATVTAGYDPLLVAQATPEAYRGVPMLLTASTSDTRVVESQNADLLMPLLSPYTTFVAHTGGHTDNTAFTTPDIAGFLTGCITIA